MAFRLQLATLASVQQTGDILRQHGLPIEIALIINRMRHELNWAAVMEQVTLRNFILLPQVWCDPDAWGEYVFRFPQ